MKSVTESEHSDIGRHGYGTETVGSGRGRIQKQKNKKGEEGCEAGKEIETREGGRETERREKISLLRYSELPWLHSLHKIHHRNI